MSDHIKLIIVAISILLIGFVAGFMVNRSLMKTKLNEVAAMRYSDGASTHLMITLQPKPTQEDLLKPMVNKYCDQLEQLNVQFSQQRNPLLDQMHDELHPHLEPDQRERLNRWIVFMKRLSPMN